jgi:hypothetical protein
MQQEWLEKHQGADFLVYSTKTKICTEATYISPMKKFQDDADKRAQSFFRMVREAEARERDRSKE